MSEMADNLKAFTDAYIEALYFTEAGPDNDIPPDAPLSHEAFARIADDCSRCVLHNPGRMLLDKAAACEGYSWARAGHDFWLTRNGHGAGYWDRDELSGDQVEATETLGDGLTQAAKAFGDVDAYLGDDGKIYLG